MPDAEVAASGQGGYASRHRQQQRQRQGQRQGRGEMQRREPAFNVPASIVVALAAMAAVHVFRSLLPDNDGFEVLVALAFVPARYSGGVIGIPGGDIASFTSPFTYMLVHGDVVHLLVNSVWMLAFGSAVARRVGNGRFAVFSLACGLAGALTHLLVHFGSATPVVGASAAISGQMAGAVRFLFSARVGGVFAPGNVTDVPLASIGATLSNPRILIFIGIWAALNLLFGLGYASLGEAGDAIAWEAHIGGFVFGLLAFGLFDRPRRLPPLGPLPQ